MLRHRVLVAQDDELHAGSRHRHVHAAKVFQETDLAFIVGTHQGDENHVSFLTLETIHRVDADEAAVRLEELILLDELLQILHLGTIRRNDAYVDAFAQYPLLAYLGEVFRRVSRVSSASALLILPKLSPTNCSLKFRSSPSSIVSAGSLSEVSIHVIGWS